MTKQWVMHDMSENITSVPLSTAHSDTTQAIVPTEYPDIKAFVNTSCGCDLATGNKPCSGLFAV